MKFAQTTKMAEKELAQAYANALPECLSPGVLNDHHRAFVLQPDLLPRPSDCKALLEFALAECSGQGDFIIVVEPTQAKIRQIVEKVFEGLKRPGHFGRINIIWNRPPRTSRMVFGDLRQIMHMTVYSKSPRVRVSAIAREDFHVHHLQGSRSRDSLSGCRVNRVLQV